MRRTTPSDRSFGWLVAAALLAVGLVPLWRDGEVREWALIAAGIFFVVGAVTPRVLRPAKTAWLFLGFLMGAVVSPIVLAVMFFGIITPLAFVLRLLGRDALRLRIERQAVTYWQDRGEPSSDLRLQF